MSPFFLKKLIFFEKMVQGRIGYWIESYFTWCCRLLHATATIQFIIMRRMKQCETLPDNVLTGVSMGVAVGMMLDSSQMLMSSIFHPLNWMDSSVGPMPQRIYREGWPSARMETSNLYSVQQFSINRSISLCQMTVQ